MKPLRKDEEDISERIERIQKVCDAIDKDPILKPKKKAKVNGE